ncbi:MAG: alpha/beta fold hydrolase [Gaiellaceae bacterium]
MSDTTEGVGPEHVSTPETRYAQSGDVHNAYQVVGEGRLDLVVTPGGSHHVELMWENPPHARFLTRLASLARMLVFDRGTGMSDRVTVAETLEARMDDIRAVMDSARLRPCRALGLRRCRPALHPLRRDLP